MTHPVSLCRYSYTLPHIHGQALNGKGNSPEDQQFWTHPPKIITCSDTQHTPSTRKKIYLCMQCKWINHSDNEEIMRSPVVALNACTAVEYKKMLTVWGCLWWYATCNKIKMTAWSTNMPTWTKRSTKCLCTMQSTILRVYSVAEILFRLAALCTFLLVLLFDTHLQGEWQLTALPEELNLFEWQGTRQFLYPLCVVL